MRKLLLGALVALAFAGNSFASFIVYDAKTDFTTANVSDAVNAPWSYGYSNVSVGGTMTNFTAGNYFNDANGFGLSLNPAPNYTPGVFKTNRNNWPYSGAPSGMFAMHSGQSDASQYSVLRFTAQTAGLYNLDVKWFAGDSNPPGNPNATAGRVSIFVNQNGTTLQSALNTLTGGTYVSPGTISLNAGEFLELRVGRGNDGYTYDTTPIEMTVTAVPEPSTLACVGGLVAGLSVLSRRRRQA